MLVNVRVKVDKTVSVDERTTALAINKALKEAAVQCGVSIDDVKYISHKRIRIKENILSSNQKKRAERAAKETNNVK